MGKKIFLGFICTGILICLTGCHKNTRYLERFPPHIHARSFDSNIDGVNVVVHQLSASESNDYFHVNLLAKGIIPIHLKINNESNNIYTIRPSYINIIPAQPVIIAKLLHWDTSWFISTAGYLSFMFWWPALFMVGQTGYDMYRANKNIDQLVQQNALSGQVLDILPFEIVEKFIFVQTEDYKQCFSLKMFNQTEHKVICFDIVLPSAST